MFRIINKAIHIGLNSIGYNSFSEAFNDIFMVKNNIISIVVFCTSIPIGLVLFLEDWVYSPSKHLAIFSILIFAEGIAGTIRATITEDEKFNLEKAIRVVPKWMAHVFLLSAAWHMAISTDIYSFLPTTVFVSLTGINFAKIVFHFSMMKLVDNRFTDMINRKFTDNNIYDDDKKKR